MLFLHLMKMKLETTVFKHHNTSALRLSDLFMYVETDNVFGDTNEVIVLESTSGVEGELMEHNGGQIKCCILDWHSEHKVLITSIGVLPLARESKADFPMDDKSINFWQSLQKAEFMHFSLHIHILYMSSDSHLSWNTHPGIWKFQTTIYFNISVTDGMWLSLMRISMSIISTIQINLRSNSSQAKILEEVVWNWLKNTLGSIPGPTFSPIV